MLAAARNFARRRVNQLKFRVAEVNQLKFHLVNDKPVVVSLGEGEPVKAYMTANRFARKPALMNFEKVRLF